MRSPRLLLSLLVVAAACGDDGGSMGTSDAPAQIDAPVDSPVLPGNCDYNEVADATNDDFSGNVANGAAEAIGAPFASGPRTICGHIDSTHFVAADELVDIDGFVFSIAADTDVRIDLTAIGAEALDDVSISVYTGANLSTAVGTTGRFVGNHAVLDLHLTQASGMFEIMMFAFNGAAITTPIAYRATITVDTPAIRCAKATGAASYAEARDTQGNGHTANDMVVITNPTVSLTPDTTDLAEPTALTIAPGTSYLVTGSSADIAASNGYKDRDTFELTTGATTNELAVRLNWPGTTQDLDFYLLEKDTVPALGRSIAAVKHEDELKTFGVKPSTAYWVLVANDATSGAGNVAYGITICGALFTP